MSKLLQIVGVRSWQAREETRRNDQSSSHNPLLKTCFLLVPNSADYGNSLSYFFPESKMDAKLSERAKRYVGLWCMNTHLSFNIVSHIDKKRSRAERFGMRNESTSNDPLYSEEKLKYRAERYAISLMQILQLRFGSPQASTSTGEAERRRKRQDRFGSTKPQKDAKLAKRAERFAVHV
jgi:hypothetical protein